MKRIILIISVIIVVACEKNTEFGFPFIHNVYYTPRNITIDRATGGTAVIYADVETYPKFTYSIDRDNLGEDGTEQRDTTILWEKYPTANEVSNRRIYEVDGCKITLSEDFKQYTIEVEKDCEWDFFQVETNRFDGARSYFNIRINPE